MNLSAALLDENVACQNELTVSTLHAKALGLGIAAVLSRADTFFMSQNCTSELDVSVNCALNLRDGLDDNLGVGLSVTLLSAVVLLGLHLVNDDLLLLTGLDDLAGDLATHGQGTLVLHHQHFEVNGSTVLQIQLLNIDLVTDGNLVLLAASLDDCVHVFAPLLHFGLALGVGLAAVFFTRSMRLY